MSDSKVISAQNLSFSYPETAAPTLNNISLEVERGEFVLLCGRTGSGKTTLLRQLIPALAPHGQLSGSLEIQGSVAFVQQDPDNQIVTDIVFHELAFALENQGIPTQIIRRKVAEIASYFGLEHLLESATHTLSGGQKQILNLAAALVVEPEILILDEPTSELDPIAAYNFLRHLVRINRELGTTVICCEHRLDEILVLCDKVFLINKELGEGVQTNTSSLSQMPSPCQAQSTASLLTYTPQEFAASCLDENKNFLHYLPEPTQIALACNRQDEGTTNKNLPLDVKEGRRWLDVPLCHFEQRPEFHPCHFERSAQARSREILNAQASSTHQCPTSDNSKAPPAITLRDLCFRYDKNEPYILKYLNAEFAPAQIHGIVGGNASGKSTLLGLISGVLKPQLGHLRIAKGFRLAALPQNSKASLVCDSVQEDLLEISADSSIESMRQLAQKLDIDHLLDRHPYDLSGGETQKAALAKLLLTSPDILLLDEPTKGLDAEAKLEIGRIFEQLAAEGKTLLLVTHDLPFAASFTHSCSLLANGELIAHGQTHDFFTGNSFYTTPTNRMTRGILDGCVTVEDAVKALQSSAGTALAHKLQADKSNKGTSTL